MATLESKTNRSASNLAPDDKKFSQLRSIKAEWMEKVGKHNYNQINAELLRLSSKNLKNKLLDTKVVH